MKLLIISPSESTDTEHIIIRNMIDKGITSLHIRKPHMSTEGLKKYLDSFPEEYHTKMIIHAHHNLLRNFNLKGIHLTKTHRKKKYRLWAQRQLFRLMRKKLLKTTSCSSISSLAESYKDFEYIMLTPIFTHKQEHRPAFSQNTLDDILAKYPGEIVARGGATIESIEKARDIGFTGIAFHNAVWHKPNPLKEFESIHARFKGLGTPIDVN